MRNAFIEQLIERAERNPRIFLVVGDLGYSVVEPFAERFPERFLNAGIAEQNMAGLAAGLASEGYQVFVYSIANFPVARCLEQIRNDVAYHGLAVTIVAVGGGLAYGKLGYSHHAVQDYALMRCLPGMLIAAPGDPPEVRACMDWLAHHPGPSYLRLGKAGEPSLHRDTPTCRPGELAPVETRKGAEDLVLSTGTTLTHALDWVRRQAGAWDVAGCPLWGEASRDTLGRALGRYRRVVIVEDHLLAGGFGSFVAETLATRSSRGPDLRLVALDGDLTEHRVAHRLDWRTMEVETASPRVPVPTGGGDAR